MCVEDATEEPTGDREETSCRQCRRPSNMGEDKKDKIRGELKRGFRKLDITDKGLASQRLGQLQ